MIYKCVCQIRKDIYEVERGSCVRQRCLRDSGQRVKGERGVGKGKPLWWLAHSTPQQQRVSSWNFPWSMWHRAAYMHATSTALQECFMGFACCVPLTAHPWLALSFLVSLPPRSLHFCSASSTSVPRSAACVDFLVPNQIRLITLCIWASFSQLTHISSLRSGD